MQSPARKQQQGFTFIELIMVMLILAIIAGVGIPSFTELMRSSEMTNRANSIIVALQLARSEAISRGRAVTACPSTNGNDCNGTNDWASGWLVATDSGTAGSIDAADGDEVLRVSSNDTQVAVDAGPNFVRFFSNGLREGDAVQTIVLSRPDCGAGDAREIEVAPTGRTQVNQADC